MKIEGQAFNVRLQSNSKGGFHGAQIKMSFKVMFRYRAACTKTLKERAIFVPSPLFLYRSMVKVKLTTLDGVIETRRKYRRGANSPIRCSCIFVISNVGLRDATSMFAGPKI